MLARPDPENEPTRVQNSQRPERLGNYGRVIAKRGSADAGAEQHSLCPLARSTEP